MGKVAGNQASSGLTCDWAREPVWKYPAKSWSLYIRRKLQNLNESGVELEASSRLHQELAGDDSQALVVW
jgi:hypothetical protein